MFIIESDFSSMEKELDRIGAMPTVTMLAYLDTSLRTSFETTRAKVHVDTGKLKKSGKTKSRSTANQWVGQFSFTAKNKKGVTYGIYEIARGGGHDFFRDLVLLKPRFISAIVRGLKN